MRSARGERTKVTMTGPSVSSALPPSFDDPPAMTRLRIQLGHSDTATLPGCDAGQGGCLGDTRTMVNLRMLLHQRGDRLEPGGVSTGLAGCGQSTGVDGDHDRATRSRPVDVPRSTTDVDGRDRSDRPLASDAERSGHWLLSVPII